MNKTPIDSALNKPMSIHAIDAKHRYAKTGETLSYGAVVKGIFSNMRSARDACLALDTIPDALHYFATKQTPDGRWLVLQYKR